MRSHAIWFEDWKGGRNVKNWKDGLSGSIRNGAVFCNGVLVGLFHPLGMTTSRKKSIRKVGSCSEGGTQGKNIKIGKNEGGKKENDRKRNSLRQLPVVSRACEWLLLATFPKLPVVSRVLEWFLLATIPTPLLPLLVAARVLEILPVAARMIAREKVRRLERKRGPFRDARK